AGDREEGLGAVLVFLRPRPRRAPLLGLSETLLGVLELLFERGRVELLGRDRLLDEEPGPVAVDLEPAVRLRVPARLRVAGVETQLGRPQRRQQRRVVGEDADLAARGAGRDLAHLAAPDLALGREDL